MKRLGFLLGAASVAAVWLISSLVREDEGPTPGPGVPSEESAAAGGPRAPAAPVLAEGSHRVVASADPIGPIQRADVSGADESAPHAPPAEFDAESFVRHIGAGVLADLEQDEHKDMRRSSIASFIKRLGYMPEQENLDCIVMIMLEAVRRKDAQVWALFEEGWTSPNPRPGEVRAEIKSQLFQEYQNELRDRLRPYVRPEVFEEAFDRWSGKWYVDHPEERREESKD
ncbi:MAG: hypothetical protein HY812_12470 [Planctomycetes bacterium]|nr:hypothetical protein [Planctomycetota bacterium]